jgi:hypothetical protein
MEPVGSCSLVVEKRRLTIDDISPFQVSGVQLLQRADLCKADIAIDSTVHIVRTRLWERGRIAKVHPRLSDPHNLTTSQPHNHLTMPTQSLQSLLLPSLTNNTVTWFWVDFS